MPLAVKADCGLLLPGEAEMLSRQLHYGAGELGVLRGLVFAVPVSAVLWTLLAGSLVLVLSVIS